VIRRGPCQHSDDHSECRRQISRRLHLGGLIEPGPDLVNGHQRDAQDRGEHHRQSLPLGPPNALRLNRKTSFPDSQIGLANADRLPAIDHDTRQPLLAAVQIDTVGSTHILDNEPAGFVSKQPQVLGRDVRIVDDDVVGVSATDPRLRSGDPEAGCDFLLTRENLDPDHLATCTASRKRLPIDMASS